MGGPPAGSEFASPVKPANKECAIRNVTKYIGKGWAVLALYFEISKLNLRRRKHNAKSWPYDCSFSSLWYRLTSDYEREGNYKAEERCIKQYVMLSPTHARGYWVLAIAHLAERRFREAIAAADRALECDRNLSGAYEVKGDARFALGEWEDAARQYRQAIWVSPYSCLTGSLHARLASAYEVLGRTEEARKHRSKAIELNSDDD